LLEVSSVFRTYVGRAVGVVPVTLGGGSRRVTGDPAEADACADRGPDPFADPKRARRRRMAETYSGEFYCVKCKEKREASGDVVVNDKGTRMAKAKCPVCGTNLNRILGKA
jgi:hypothetical protein